MEIGDRFIRTMNDLSKPAKPSSLSAWWQSSLAEKTLLKMGVRIALITVAAATFTYFHIFSILNEQVDDSLQKYIVERGQKESAPFLMAEANHLLFKEEFLTIWPTREHAVTPPRFESVFDRREDGSMRLSESAYYGRSRQDGSISRYISGFVGPDAPKTSRFYNKLLLSYELIDRFADAWGVNFDNLYVSMLENVNMVYWPGLPWGMQADANLDVTEEEWVTVAIKENNPERLPVWTGLYFDPTADEWMVSLKTPVDVEGEHLIDVGTDILLNRLFEKVFNDHLDGAYNFIFRADGRIIAHPRLVEKLREQKGLLHVSEAGDGELEHMIAQITDHLTEVGNEGLILDDDTVSAKMAVTRLSGPEWLFVTVYPHQLMAAAAFKTVLVVAGVGVLSLIFELIFLFIVLREQVLGPVRVFDGFARRFAAREFSRIDDLASSPLVKRHDEIGALALAMTGMARSIERYENRLTSLVEQRTQQLDEANQVLQEESAQRKRITYLLQVIAKDVSGLQGDQFFMTLSKLLSDSLKADMVMVGRLVDDGRAVQTLSLMIDGNMLDSMYYPLIDTPCQQVINHGAQIYNGDVQQLFPRDEDLFKLNMHAYIGTQMLDRAGKIVGHLAVLKRGAFEQQEIASLIIDSVSTRAAYELDRQLTEEVILRQATIDPLTSLPNRAAFMDRLQQSLLHAERDGEQLAVMFIDVDNFKLVNDQEGHATGDHVLKVIANRLIKCVRKNDILGRLGGDEFIVALDGISDVYAPEQVARSLLEEISREITYQQHAFVMSCSIGISIYPNDAQAIDSLINHADVAMYRAKELGRNNYQFFERAMNEDVEYNNRLELALRQALGNKELEVYYQPIVLLSDKRVYKLEALLRWQHPELGMVMPDQFIGIAERSGLIVAIGEFVLEQVSRDFAGLKQYFNGLESISVNFSARQFRDGGLVDRATDIVEQQGIRCGNIEIEITESMFIDERDKVTIQTLHELSERGFRIALDDFGTGYSSLGYLKKVPIDTLKVDRSFVRGLFDDPDDLALVSSIIELAHSFRLAVIAEGVENQQQEDILRVEGCDFAQGYHYARPMPINELLAWGESVVSRSLAVSDETA